MTRTELRRALWLIAEELANETVGNPPRDVPHETAQRLITRLAQLSRQIASKPMDDEK